MADVLENEAIVAADAPPPVEQVQRQLVNVLIGFPEGSQKEFQLTGEEQVMDLRDGLFQLQGLGHTTCFDLVIDGVVMQPFQKLEEVPGFEAGCLIQVTPAPYSKQEIIMHLARLQSQIDPLPQDCNLAVLLASVENEENELKRSRQAQQQQQQQQRQQQQQQNNSGGKGKGKNKKKKKKKAPVQQKPAAPAVADESYTLAACRSNNMSDLKLTRPTETTPLLTIKMSAWNPPPQTRILAGDIMYLKVRLSDGTKYQVTAGVKGFFLNSTTKDAFDAKPAGEVYSTLPGLLASLRPSFGESLEKYVNEKYSSLTASPFEADMVGYLQDRKEWVQASQPHVKAQPFIDLMHESPMYNVARDWNDELQKHRSMPQETVEESLVRERLLNTGYQEFIETATEVAKQIINGEFQPANPMDPEPLHLYIRNSMFFMYASGDKYEVGDKPADDDPFSYKLSNCDILGANIYNALGIEGLHSVQTALIHYRGRHVFAQGIVPGVLDSAEKTLAYGTIDQGKTVNCDEEFHKLMLEAAKKLNIATCRFRDEAGKEVELAAPVYTKGVKGSDDRYYAMDFECVSAYDPSGGKRYSIYRPELIRNYIGHLRKLHTNAYRSKVQAIVQEKREEKRQAKEKEAADAAAAGTAVTPPTEEEGKAEEAAFIAEIEALVAEMPKEEFVVPKLNPNYNCPVKFGKFLLSEEEVAEQKELHKALADYRTNVAIPSLVRDLQSCDMPPDSEKLCSLMHMRGINYRCLGQVSELLAKGSREATKNLVYSEMVVRTAKHIFNGFLLATPAADVSKVTATFLTTLVGALGSVSHPAIKTPNANPLDLEQLSEVSLYREIFALVKSRFGVTLPVSFVKQSADLRVPILRNFCMKAGIVLALRRYNLSKGFTADDIVGLEPVVKATSPLLVSARNLLDVGSQYLVQNKFDVAYDYLQEALTLCQHTCGPMHLLTAVCYQSLATVLGQAGDIPQAISYFQHSLVILERIHGSDRHDTVTAYVKLGELYASASRPRHALALFKRALYLLNLLYDSEHVGVGTVHNQMGKMLQNLKQHSAALEHFRRSLEIFENIVGPDTFFSAALSHDMAVSHSFLGQNKEALELEKKNYAFLSTRAGEKDESTVQSGIWLKQFTLKAVQEAREAQRAPTAGQPERDAEEVPLFNRPIPDILKYINGGDNKIGRRPRGPPAFGRRGVPGVFGRKP